MPAATAPATTAAAPTAAAPTAAAPTAAAPTTASQPTIAPQPAATTQPPAQPTSAPTVAPPTTVASAPTVAPPTPTVAPSDLPVPTAVPSPTASPPSNAPAPCAPSDRFSGDDGGTLVVYHKKGGFAYVDETLIVRASGSLLLNEERGGHDTGQVSPADMDQLRALLDGPAVAALAARYGMGVPADGYLYEIFIPCLGGARTDRHRRRGHQSARAADADRDAEPVAPPPLGPSR